MFYSLQRVTMKSSMHNLLSELCRGVFTVSVARRTSAETVESFDKTSLIKNQCFFVLFIYYLYFT